MIYKSDNYAELGFKWLNCTCIEKQMWFEKTRLV